jgi:hypothetical protein
VNFILKLKTEADLEVTGSTEQKSFLLPENPANTKPVIFGQTFQIRKLLASPVQDISVQGRARFTNFWHEF